MLIKITVVSSRAAQAQASSSDGAVGWAMIESWSSLLRHAMAPSLVVGLLDRNAHLSEAGDGVCRERGDVLARNELSGSLVRDSAAD